MKKLVFVLVFSLIAGATSSVYAQTVHTKIEPEPQMRSFEFLAKISLGVVNSLSQQVDISVPREFENSDTDSATENISLLGPTIAFELYAGFFGVGTSLQFDNSFELQDEDLNDKWKMGFTNLYFSLKPSIYSSKDGYLYLLGHIGISMIRENYGKVLETYLKDEFSNTVPEIANHIRVSSKNDYGLYASLGLGYITSSNFLFELSWQMKQAKIKADVYFYGEKIETINIDQTLNTLMLTVGYRI